MVAFGGCAMRVAGLGCEFGHDIVQLAPAQGAEETSDEDHPLHLSPD